MTAGVSEMPKLVKEVFQAQNVDKVPYFEDIFGSEGMCVFVSRSTPGWFEFFFFLRFKTKSLVQNQTSLCMNVCLCTRGIRCVIHCVSTSAKIRKPRGILETMLTGISTTTSDEWL